MHATGDIFDGNVCHDYCIQSTDSSLSIDLQSLYQYENNVNFITFHGLSSSFKSSICIDGANTIQISKYLSFDDHSNRNNTKLIFNECADPFAVSYPNISSVRLSTFEQVYLNDIAGGAVLDTFICDDNTATCSIVCNNSVSCFSSTFVVNTAVANINCGSNFACGYSTINGGNNSSSLHIVCDDETSCLHSTINVNQLELFVLECVQTDSCSDITVNIENTITSSIICHHVGACDALAIHTDSDHTTLTLYEYSKEILFDTPSGFTEHNLICNPNHAYIMIDDEFTSINHSVTDIYEHLPCSDVTFDCNKTDTCRIKYESSYALEDWEPFFDCYGPIALDDIYSLSCLGTCPASPTMAPSSAPTLDPTETTVSPTAAPSTSPSNQPTYAPTTSPTVAPSHSPSTNPTLSPTYSPSKAPTHSPTFIPTFSPSDSPSFSPTQHPISSVDFDSYLMIRFVLGNLTVNDPLKLSIVNDPLNETQYIEYVIENEYFLENVITYEKYLVHILDIEATEIDDIDENTKFAWTNLDQLKLNTKIECDQNDQNVNYCEFIKQQSQPENPFCRRVETVLQSYFNNDELSFSVYEAQQLEIECKDCLLDEATPDYVLRGLMALVGFLCILAILAFLFNTGIMPKLPGFNYVDDAKWAALIMFALQFWDFYSDINLSVEIMQRDDLFDNFMILLSGFGSVLFTVIPYIANLILAANIKSIIRYNAAAKGWFQYHTPVFTILVVLSGGVHAALSLVSSGIFGLKIFSCGLTQYELKGLGRLKVFGTVVLENIPQLICQALYTSTTGINSTIAMAFIASFLSVIASTLSFWIERDTADTKVVQYYVSTQCSVRNGKQSFDLDHLDDLEDMQERNISTNVSTTKSGETVTHRALKQTDADDDPHDTTIQSPSHTATTTITTAEKRSVIDNRGKTLALGESIAEVFRIPSKNIEVGHSMVTKHGVITHIVHYIYDMDLETMQEELNAVNDNMIITAQYFAQQLFTVFRSDISRVFRTHFALNKDFEVAYHHRLAVGKRIMGKQKSDHGAAAGYDEGSMEGPDPRRVVLHRVMTQISHVAVTDPQSKAIRALKELFESEGAQNDEDRLDLYLSLMKGVDACLNEEEEQHVLSVGADINHDGALSDTKRLGKSKKNLLVRSLASRMFAQKSKSISVVNESDEDLSAVEMEEIQHFKSNPL